MTDIRRIAARVFNTPLLVTPEVAATISELVQERDGGASTLFRASAGESDRSDDDGYSIADGVATIAVRGELVNRGSWLNSLSGMTSYEELGAALRKAHGDWRVKGILLDMDSPGGEASGAMETADLVREVSGAKPVVAFVNSLAASAAYAIAAAAKKIVVTPSATVGSIGVVWLHLDRSKAIAERGLKPTFLHAGAFKVDGNSLQALDPDAKTRIQAQIDGIYDLFTASVGKHRPKLGVEAARKTEAGLFMGAKAVEAGLADAVGTMEVALKFLPRSTPFAFARTSRSPSMANPDEPIFTQAAHDAAVINASAKACGALRIELEAAHASALAAAGAAATTAERERIKSILDGETAKGREATARKLAFTTNMTPVEATSFLADLPATPTTPAKPGARMDALAKPPVKPGSAQASVDAQGDADAMWSSIAETQNKRAGLPARH